MKTHLSLGTHDLSASVDFYRSLLGCEPTKHYPDYALFLTDSPGLELALALDRQAKVSSDHYGIAVDTPELVETATQRLRKAALPVDIEIGETCCYAVQNKVWATDPDGRRWETYYVIAETEKSEGAGVTCCRDSNTESTPCCAP